MLFDGYVMFTAPKGKTRISHRRKSSSTHKLIQYSDSVNVNELMSVSYSVVGKKHYAHSLFFVISSLLFSASQQTTTIRSDLD